MAENLKEWSKPGKNGMKALLLDEAKPPAMAKARGAVPVKPPALRCLSTEHIQAWAFCQNADAKAAKNGFSGEF